MGTPETPVKDKQYNLVWALHQSLQNIWQIETYIADAEREDDNELAEWFRKVQLNNRKAAHQAKRMLAARLQAEGE